MRDGWSEKTLDGIADVIMGQSPDGKSYNQEGKGLPFMQGSAEFGEHNPMPEKWCSDPKKIAEPGDLLLSVRAPVGDTNFADQRIAVGRGLSIIRANKKSLTEFIRLVIQMNVAELIASSGSGMFASITGKNLKEFKVNLPPLPEQERIVDLISSMDDGISATEKLISQTKQMRSGLLSDLLSGEHEIPTSYDKVIGAA
jgi:type I restriction enzyme S subunit